MVGGTLPIECCIPANCNDVDPPVCSLTQMRLVFSAVTTGGTGPSFAGPSDEIQENVGDIQPLISRKTGCYGCPAGTSSDDVIQSTHTFDFTFDIVQGTKGQRTNGYYRPNTSVLLATVDSCAWTYNAQWRSISGSNTYQYTTCTQVPFADTTQCSYEDACIPSLTFGCCEGVIDPYNPTALFVNGPGSTAQYTVVGGLDGWGTSGSNFYTFVWAGASLVTASIRIVFLSSSTARGAWKVTSTPTSFKIESALGDVYTWGPGVSLFAFITAISADPTSGTNPYLRIRTNGNGYSLLGNNILPGDVRLQGEFVYPDPYAVQCDPTNNLTSGIYFPIVYPEDETWSGWPSGAVTTGTDTSSFLPNQAGLIQFFSQTWYPKFPLPAVQEGNLSGGCFGYPTLNSLGGGRVRPVFYNWVFSSVSQSYWSTTGGASVVTKPTFPDFVTIITDRVDQINNPCQQEFNYQAFLDCLDDADTPAAQCACIARQCTVCGGNFIPDPDPLISCGTCQPPPGTDFSFGPGYFACGTCNNPDPSSGCFAYVTIVNETTIENFECGGLQQAITGSCNFS